ncbi:MAG TPA: type II secretion system protein [Candidatus Saccharimonadales bacterium]|nr:type II secretion system protein [Candidatus Saccharimonadales bacterium]
MLSKLHKSKKEQGFTIIEVLIVLAIAGLILLVVFLAVPALQRNSRNTQRKDDVARVGSAVQEFINNNAGTLPVAGDSATVRNLVGTLAYYSSANVSVAGTAPSTATNDTTTDTVKIYTGGKCTTMTGGRGVISSGNSRTIAMTYSTETAGAAALLCTDS